MRSRSRFLGLALAALAVAALGACHDSDSGGGGQASFDALVTDLIQNQTSESGEPVEVDGTGFAFPDGEDAFDDILPPDAGSVVE